MNFSKIKVMLIHGNGMSSVQDHWFPWLKEELEQIGFKVIARDFPEAEIAPMNVWLPHMKELGADDHTVIVGHSSGAAAAMRYAEENKLLGSVLIGCNYTDLGFEDEKKSGYYKDPWNWETIKKNQKFIVEFASTDDPFINIEEPRLISEKLGSEYYEYTDKGHFMFRGPFPELLETIQRNVRDL